MTLNVDHHTAEMKLELVQVLFRHGERTPVNKELNILGIADLSLYEPYGLEQLTKNGKTQAYSLGCTLRSTYASFLNARYHSNDVYAYSSDSDRTKTSLQLVLAGLYPPTPELCWNPELPWIPIPYYCVSNLLDTLLCIEMNPRFLGLVQMALDSAEMKEILSNHSELLSYIRDKSGINIEKNVLGMMHGLDTLAVNSGLNIPVPDWYTEETREKCSALFVLVINTALETLKKQCGGTIVKQFLRNMNVDGRVDNPRKIYLYSGHDLNIMAVLRALNVDVRERPDFATALILEKYRDSNNELYVKLLLRDTIRENTTTLKLDGRNELCHIDDFIKMTESVIPADEELDCFFKDFDCKKLKDFCLKDPLVK